MGGDAHAPSDRSGHVSESTLNKHQRSFAVGTLFLGIALAGWFMLEQSRRGFSGFVMSGDLGPFFLAELCLSAIALTGLAMLVQGGYYLARARHNPARAPRNFRAYLPWLMPVLFAASMVLLPMAMRTIGTIPALGGFSMLWIFVLFQQAALRKPISSQPGPEKSASSLRRSVLMALAGGAGVAAFVQIVFVRLLNLPLPG